MGQADHFLEAGPTSLMRRVWGPVWGGGVNSGFGSLWYTTENEGVGVADQAPATDQLCRLGQVT